MTFFGLPNVLGEYEETPENMARNILSFAEDGFVITNSYHPLGESSLIITLFEGPNTM